MRRFKLVVLANATDGLEDEFNDWYDNVHLRDVVAIAGIRRAERFKLQNPMGFAHQHTYLAIYDVESDDPDGVVKELLSRRGTPSMVLSDALNLDTAVAGVFESCSPVVTEDKAKSVAGVV